MATFRETVLAALHVRLQPVEAPVPVDLPVEGAAAIKAAVITVVLHHTTASPLA